jgi:hypothetical protein
MIAKVVQMFDIKLDPNYKLVLLATIGLEAKDKANFYLTLRQ